MNTYLIPVADREETYICKISSRNLIEAKDKFIDEMVETYDIDYPGDMAELADYLNDEGVQFGRFYDAEEF